MFKDLDVAKHLSNLHDSYVLVQAEKAPNKNESEIKNHYLDYLIKELVIDNSLVNPPLTPKMQQQRN
jgi:hypothetical protein